jgi:hypothetical protein
MHTQLPSDAALADETNARLLEAVRSGCGREARRALEEGAGAWLSSRWAHNEDESSNPVLLALTVAGGLDALDEMDDWLGGVCDWSMGRWKPIHWACASRHAEAVRWCLDRGASLSDQEKPSERSFLARSALAIVVQIGDSDWLMELLRMVRGLGAEKWSQLLRQDGRGPGGVSAIGTALFQMAQADLDSPGGESGRWRRCARLLARCGFQPDTASVVAAKLAGALAPDVDPPGDARMLRPAVDLALALGSGESDEPGAPTTGSAPFDRAGWRLDAEWRESLLACGFEEGVHGCWGQAAASRLLASFEIRMDSFSPQTCRRLAKAMDDSFSRAGVPVGERPMRGLEGEFLDWMAQDSRQRLPASFWLERLALARAARTPASQTDRWPERTLRL